MPTLETQLKQQIKGYLNLKQKFWWYNLQGLGAYKGIPDFMVLNGGVLYGIEVKAPKGYLSIHQQAFRSYMTTAGGVFIEARKLEDVMDLIK